MMTQILFLGKGKETKEQVISAMEMHQMAVVAETSADKVLAELGREDVAYAALVLDGEQSGIDTGRFVENVRELKKLPVLMIGSSETEAIKFLEFGADLCLIKPFTNGMLSAQILALIRMQERLQSEEIRRDALPELRGIRMDPVRRRVRVRGKEKRFTRKEFDLLYFMMTHPETVYTKEQLYSEVWHEEAVGGMATVVMHIKKIRNIIEEKPAQPRILKTDWGVGYYFAQFDED